MKLDLGCGQDKEDGYMGLDIVDYGQDFVCNVLDIVPIVSGVWEQIRAKHFLEHFVVDDVIKILNECHKVCKELHVVVPSIKREGAYKLTHKSFYTEATFMDLERKENLKQYGIKTWKVKKIVTNGKGDIHCWLKPV